jgi:type I restriction enzyme M protein
VARPSPAGAGEGGRRPGEGCGAEHKSTGAGGNLTVVEYEPDPELRDFEQIPLLEEGGIEAFIRREVLPYTPDAWIVETDTKIGYEISFTRHFYQPPQLRTLAEISADILKLEQETEGLLTEITKGATK